MSMQKICALQIYNKGYTHHREICQGPEYHLYGDKPLLNIHGDQDTGDISLQSLHHIPNTTGCHLKYT